MLRLYNTALLPLRLAAACWSRWQPSGSARRREWDERRVVLLPTAAPGGVWIHGSSVGEAQIVRAVARQLRRVRPELPLSASAFTRTGREQLPAPPDVDAAFFMPLDFRGYSTRLIEALRPTLLGLVETELWPNAVHEANASGVAVAMLNARLSPHRMKRYRRFSALYRPLLDCLCGVAAQSDDDAARFDALGVPTSRIVVTGNVKYDLPVPQVEADALRQRFGLSTRRRVFAAGSTGEGEEPLVLDAFLHARSRHAGLCLLLAPRHPERVDGVADELARRKLSFARLSGDPAAIPPDVDVLLVDTVGELAALYRMAAVAFVGGSLVPIGGHNLLEPAAVGVPVLFGPHTDHVSEMASTLEQAGAGLRVQHAMDLGDTVARLLADDDERERIASRAESVLSRNRGACKRTVDWLLALLPEAPGSRSPVGVA